MSQLFIGALDLSPYKPFNYINGGGNSAWITSRVYDVPSDIIHYLYRCRYYHKLTHFAIYANQPAFYHPAYFIVPLHDFVASYYLDGRIASWRASFHYPNNRFGNNLELEFLSKEKPIAYFDNRAFGPTERP